jgi:hypothetical protein
LKRDSLSKGKLFNKLTLFSSKKNKREKRIKRGTNKVSIVDVAC